jgi:hypothetical protein
LFWAPSIIGSGGVGAFDAFTKGPTPFKLQLCRTFGEDLLVMYDREPHGNPRAIPQLEEARVHGTR